MWKAYCKTNFNVFLHRKPSRPETQPPCQTYNQVQDHCGFTTIYPFTLKIRLVILSLLSVIAYNWSSEN